MATNSDLREFGKILNYKDVGKRLKNARKNKKITQQQLADSIYKTESSIRKYEKGLIEIPINVLKDLAKSLDISFSYLVGLDDYKKELNDIVSQEESFKTEINKLIEEKSNYEDEPKLDQYKQDVISLNIKKAEKIESFISAYNVYNEIVSNDLLDQIINLFNKLNSDGQFEAVKRIDELTYIEKYTQ